MMHTREEVMYSKQNEMLLEKIRIRDNDIDLLGKMLAEKDKALSKYKYLLYVTVGTSLFTAFIILERLFEFMLSKL